MSDIVTGLIILFFVVNGIRNAIKSMTPKPPPGPAPGSEVSTTATPQRPLAGPYSPPPTMQTAGAQRPLQPGQLVRSANPRPARPMAGQSAKPPAGPPATTVVSSAPMSDTAMSLEQQRREIDQLAKLAASTEQQNLATEQQAKTLSSTQSNFLSGRYPLLDAIILSEVLGPPKCRRMHGRTPRFPQRSSD